MKSWLLGSRSRATRATCRLRWPQRGATSTDRAWQLAAFVFHFIQVTTVFSASLRRWKRMPRILKVSKAVLAVRDRFELDVLDLSRMRTRRVFKRRMLFIT